MQLWASSSDLILSALIAAASFIYEIKINSKLVQTYSQVVVSVHVGMNVYKPCLISCMFLYIGKSALNVLSYTPQYIKTDTVHKHKKYIL